MKKQQKAKSQKSSNLSKKTKNTVKKKNTKGKVKSGGLLLKTKKKLGDIKKKSSKSLRRAKDKVYATEEEISQYVKENPIKSLSAMALTALITGFLAFKSKK